jgi:hypothetical protein
MKALGIAGQDIHALSLAFLSERGVEEEQIISCTPETYLSTIVETLRIWKVAPKDMSHLVIVRGPGSFTASRVSTILGNAFAFTKQIPVLAIENTTRKSWKELAPTIPWSQASKNQWVMPLYDRPPHITLPS